MKTYLPYGNERLELELDATNVTVIEPRFLPGLADEAVAFEQAVRNPIGCRPLRETILASDQVAVVIPDITRPLPTERLLPWLFAELGHVPADHFVIVNGTGSHRANTPAELAAMCGAKVAQRYQIVNHDAHDRQSLEQAGVGEDGQPVFYNRQYCQADKRIVLGFIEPN
ncbi:MAG TPA: lactate racemase domain-containing protein, partial [Pirellulales bacterium]|nr:lactate racemase domain-containing protein [Pirellulales bacterium]